jgi:hypothetical protein
MHPNIKKFWENTGHKVFVLHKYHPDVHWQLTDGTIIAEQIFGKEIKYIRPCSENLYSEEQMLRIIKLRAFL